MGLQTFIIEGNKLRLLSQQTVFNEHFFEVSPEVIQELETFIRSKEITTVHQLVEKMNLLGCNSETWGISEQDEVFDTLNLDLGEEINNLGNDILGNFKYF